MENKIKTFRQFVNENEMGSEEDALDFLASMGMLHGEELIKALSRHLSKVFEVDLVEAYSDSDDYGLYIAYDFEPNPIGSSEYESPGILIYEDSTAQFFYDATPYPVAANTKEEARQMMMAMDPAPVKVELFTKEDFDNFIDAIKQQIEE